jgi:hypothetical protein
MEKICLARRDPSLCAFLDSGEGRKHAGVFQVLGNNDSCEPLNGAPNSPNWNPANAEYPCLLGDILSIPPNSLRFIGSGHSPDNLLPKMFKFF